MWVCETSMRDLPPLTSFSEKSIWIHVQERTDYGAGSHFLVQSTGDRPGVQERCACVATSPGQGAPVLSLGFRIIPASFYGKTPNILPKWLFEPFWNFKKQFDLKSSFQQKKTVKNTHDIVLSTGFQTFHQRTPPPAAARWRSSTPAPAKRRWPQRRAAAAGRPMDGSKPLTIFGKWGHCDVFMIQTLWMCIYI